MSDDCAAQLFSWTGGGSNNNWSNATNWGGVVPTDGSADLFFPPNSSSHTSVNNLGTFDLELLFLSGTTPYTISGNTLRFSATTPELTVSSGAHTINNPIVISQPLEVQINSGDSLNLNGNLSGSADITKINSGLLVFDGSNGSWSGDLDIQAGTVRFDPGDALSVNSDLHLAAGATADFSPEGEGFGDFSGAGHLEFGNTVDIFSHFATSKVFGGTASGANAHLRKQGPGDVRFSPATVDIDRLTIEDGSFTVAGDATVSVDNTVNVQAQLIVTGTGVLAPGGNLTVEPGGNFILSDGTQSSSNVVVQAGGKLTAVASTTGTIDGGFLTVADSADLILEPNSTLRLRNHAIGLLGDLTSSDDFRLLENKTLVVESGASLTSSHFTIFDGTVLVSDANSVLQLQEGIRLGSESAAGVEDTFLTVSNGGSVTSSGIAVVTKDNRDGRIVVTGADSSMLLTGNLRIVDAGDAFHLSTASLMIADGASVTCDGVYVEGTDALISVSGAGSSLTANDLEVADSPGVMATKLEIADGAVVTVANQTTVRFVGRVDLNGGVFSTDSLFINGKVAVNGGKLVAHTVDLGTTGVLEFETGTFSVEQFPADLDNPAGKLAPGGVEEHSIGMINVLGDYSQQADAALEVDLSGTLAVSEHDLVSITDNALLGGELQISLVDFTPDSLDTFTVLGADTITGVFSNVTTGQRIKTIDGAGSFQVNYGFGSAFAPNEIVLSSFLPTFTADFDFDGDVDEDDLDIWQANYGLGNGADADGDGDSDGNDFLTWQQQFGSGVSATAVSSAIPEPSVQLLFMAAIPLLSAFRWS